MKQELIDLASYYGFDLVHAKDHPDYSDRKAGVFILTDRRTNLIACTYATSTQVKNYLKRFSP